MSGQAPFPDFRPTELSLLCSETESQMQRTLKGLHRALLNRQTELRRAARRAAAAAPDADNPTIRRRRLLDELRHGRTMAELAARRGDAEEAAYRAERERQLLAELGEVDPGADVDNPQLASETASAGLNKVGDVSRSLLSAAFAEAIDEFQAELLAEMRAVGAQLAEQEVGELAAEDNLGL